MYPVLNAQQNNSERFFCETGGKSGAITNRLSI